ncbi:MAG: hypothetical protein KBF93_07480 [Leptospiraceae bacterium]|nr:hypothetical protein [Leptospiraceae bacterium]
MKRKRQYISRKELQKEIKFLESKCRALKTQIEYMKMTQIKALQHREP